jgi:hypothetical protein
VVGNYAGSKAEFEKLTNSFMASMGASASSGTSSQGRAPAGFSADTQKFGIRIFLVPNTRDFMEMWARPETPHLTTLSQVETNQQFAAVVLYWGGVLNEEGHCDIAFRTSVTQGERKLMEGEEKPLCAGHAPPPAGALAAGDVIVDLRASGSPAKLVVHVEAHDRNSGEVLTVSAPVEVIAK